MAGIKQNIVYGPVLSRRLGISLGINLLPVSKKICTFDCLYCECGWTEVNINGSIKNYDYPELKDIKDALVSALSNNYHSIDHITFAGNGEPTLHPDFSLIVDEVITIRNKFLPESKIAILSNSTTLKNVNILEALKKLDLRIMKLDAGNQETFKIYNRSVIEIKISDIIEGLMNLKEIVIQSLFTKGKCGNYNNKNISDWINLLLKIKPKSVQIYSLDRSYPSDDILPLNTKELTEIQSELEKYNIKVEVF